MSLLRKQSTYERVVMGLALLALVAFVVEGCTKKKGAKGAAGPDVKGEAAPKLKYIFDGAKGYFEKGAVVTRSGEITALQFPASVRLTPPVPCEGQPGDKCQNTDWTDGTWAALGFELSAQKHKFRYEFVSSGEVGAATFTARAVAYDKGKKDWIVVERKGTVDAEMRVVGSATLAVRRIKSIKELTGAYTMKDHELDSCKKYNGVQKLSKEGAPLRKGKKPLLVLDKHASYCLGLWGKRCSVKDFDTKHSVTCKKVRKKLGLSAPKGDDDEEE